MSIFAAFVIALLVSLLFAPGYRRSGSMVPLVIFFFILFMAGIASQFWITPFGPQYAGVYWFPNVFFVILLAFLFLAPSSYPDRRMTSADKVDAGIATAASVAVSAFVWVIFLALVIAIIAGFLRNPDHVNASTQNSNPTINQTSVQR